MSKGKQVLTGDTLIIWNLHPVNEYRKFFLQATGEKEIAPGGMIFQNWLFSQAGKTLAEALEEYLHPSEHENIAAFLTERRFDLISESEKEFIVAFDKEMNNFGYDFGGAIISGNVFSPMVIIYGKSNTKSRPCAARIYIRDTGILLRMFFQKVDSHRQYIENAPPHIKEAFSNQNGLCTRCWENCPSRPAVYTVDGQQIQKCHHHTFYFENPSLEKLSDYISLFNEFYPSKNK